jgi:hypothetical protein
MRKISHALLVVRILKNRDRCVEAMCGSNLMWSVLNGQGQRDV